MPRRKNADRRWWADRWLGALDGPWEGRLSRGRTYAQAGRVHDLQIEPGLVTARVIGTRPTPYRVELRLPTLDDAVWARVVEGLARRADTEAAMLNGDLPPEAEAAFALAGAFLFPTPDERVAASCSCPDWVRPCKHAAAVMHVVAAQMERDPFVLFALRGRMRDELLAMLRAERAKGAPAAPNGAAPGEPSPELAAPVDLARSVERFWAFDPPAEQPASSAEPTGEGSPVLKRLGQPPRALGGAELRRELETAYQLLAERAREVLTLDPASRRARQHAEDGTAEG